jgi:hypothetical protein
MNPEKEIDFLRTYKDFIYYFNMLEQNIGYCLQTTSKMIKQKNPNIWLTCSFDRKIKRLIKLAGMYNLETLFHEWHLKVQECRHLKNIIAYGRWEWSESNDKPIGYHATEIKNGKGSFTTNEFRVKLKFLQEIFKSFHAIRTPLELACSKSAQQHTADNTDKPRV